MTTQPPIAQKKPITRSFHGYDFVDNYEWLRDKESPETISYLEAENAYTQQQTQQLETLRENIFHEIKSRVKETDMSIPQRMENYWYYSRTIEGKSYGISCRVPVAEGQDAWVPPVIPETGEVEGEEIMLDLNALAEGHDYFQLGASSVTRSGRYLAYSTDVAGDERFTLRIKDLETGELLDDVIENIHYGATWVGDEYVFYTRVDDAWRADSVWRHKVGTPAHEDVRVFYEPDERFNVGIGGVRSKKYLIIGVGSRTTSEAWMLETTDPEGEFRCILPRTQGVEYDLDHAEVGGQDCWVVIHNAHGPNFAMGWSPIDAELNLDDLNPLLPHREDVRLDGVDCYRDFIFVGYREGAIGRAAVMRLGDEGFGAFEELCFDEEIYSVGVGGNPAWDAPVVRISYTSFTTPSQLFDYTVATGEFTLLKEQEVLGGYDREHYTSRRMWVRAQDGTLIPVSIVHRADLDTSSPKPTMLYAYGSYEASMEPGFSVLRLSLLDRGMIFALAHVRGGGEMGRAWYDNGKMLCKRNTFTDFIDVADALIAEGITAPEMLVANGGSAGGLLMGAVANMAPEKFKAIEADVPFVDPLTTILKPELPLTAGEWEEWGNPIDSKEVYEYMASYSPYENVEAKNYPNILATTSLNDTRVYYVEPAKWVAKLRDTATGGQFLLKTEMVAGHGGVSGRYESWRQAAFEYAWLINQATGITE
ncbi:S9 family peptidase [Corynebacterium felinum]|uniref:Oligopeptidase B n=1 Tax=Corynebacterium felinum TaxID=131318 RepID=A0ABU2B5T7_9CORY|nr:S9 family peptidase [Corynebacterium felinum]MDF5821658.1 S9 family peptidase [Corynebacterium felinum]MDR7353751.1 oligopeptidase B [Corynebacterium felinum]WJY95930.1 Protease 2 [Corynebacterium felinum]